MRDNLFQRIRPVNKWEIRYHGRFIVILVIVEILAMQISYCCCCCGMRKRNHFVKVGITIWETILHNMVFVRSTQLFLDPLNQARTATRPAEPAEPPRHSLFYDSWRYTSEADLHSFKVEKPEYTFHTSFRLKLHRCWRKLRHPKLAYNSYSTAQHASSYFE